MNYDYRLLRLPIYDFYFSLNPRNIYVLLLNPDHSRVLYRNKIHLQTVSDEFEVLQEYII